MTRAASATSRGDATPRSVDTVITYVLPGPTVHRRFVASGVEVNTGTYQAYPVRIRDARDAQERITLDSHGFELFRHVSAVKDFHDAAGVEAIYPGEVEALVKRLTGADCVVQLGWMNRSSGDLSKRQKKVVGYSHYGGVQPPAGEAHVDFTPETADARAKATYDQHFPGGKPYKRFLASSLWRAFSPPPQDWPLALCDGNSLGSGDSASNELVICDEIPDREAMLSPSPPGATGICATIFYFNPDHRWWYFSNMTRDEVILLKFYDSDRDRAWRAPHTAFHDPSFPDAHIRESIEVRSIAYFL